MRKYLLLLLIGIAFLIPKNVKAQGVTTASVNGVITDAKGTIPGATISITHVPTGTVYATVTRIDGRFNLPNLRVGGPYTFKISFIGYKTFTQENITLSIGQDQKIDVKIENNAITLQEVQVKGTPGKVINSSRTGASETITRSQIDIIPTVNRSLSDIIKLTPSANGLSIGGRSASYNNMTVDGALFNNSFGLQGTLGGQTNSQPISLDAIDQVQVDIAPYDVRQGNFTGAGINTVVKSGTNTLKGTVYDYIRSTGLQGYQVGPTTIAKTPFSYRQTGFSLGGPIVKNKLFIFISGEQERISQPATTYVAAAPGLSGATVSQVDAATLNAISNTLQNKYSYNPGSYQGYNNLTYSDKATVKLDWNIDKNNTLSAKYFYLKSYADQSVSSSTIVNAGVGFGSTRASGPTTLPFSGAGYRINNNFNIGIIELDSRISSKVSNRLTAGYSALRDYRAAGGSGTVPMADIGNGITDATGKVITGANATQTSFGYELFTANNILSTNIIQFSDDLTIFAGKHEITIGTSDQIQSYINGFAPEYNGLYTYNSASDFTNGLPAAAYSTRNSALPDGSFPYAKIKASIYSVYVQDNFHITDNFKLTYGIRADYDAFPTSLPANSNVAALTEFQQGITVDPSKLPKNRVQISPRIGFNWDVNGDGTTQIRGGSGLFAGPVPFVWISNQASNNGVSFGSYTVVKGVATNTPAQNAQLIYNPNVGANRPVGGAVANTSYELDVTDPNLKYPKIWRSNLAIDQRLPGGIIATLEGSYTKDINAIYHQNLVLSNDYTTDNGIEGQIHYTSKNVTPVTSAATAQNPAITGLYYMTNTNHGYSYFITGQLQKSFSNGLYFNAAYTRSGSKDVNDGGSTANGIWSSRPVAGNPNGTNLSNSSYVQPNRIIATAAYKKDFWKNTNSTFGLELEIANSGAVSYITSGDPNNDGATNDLMYIPKNQSDIIMVPDFVGDTRTAGQEWNQLNSFINQDSYLSKHKGSYAQRNAVILPYYARVDLHLAQDFYVMVGKNKNTIEIAVDIINFGNLLNNNWGIYKTSYNGSASGTTTVLNYKGIDPATGRPQYSFPYLDKANLIPVTKSFSNAINTTPNSMLSRYQAQIGLRYIFN